MTSIRDLPFSMVLTTGALTVVLGGALAYILLSKQQQQQQSSADKQTKEQQPPLDRQLYPGGLLKVYYATQTGTAESFAATLEREGPEKGFLVQVIDLEDVESLHSLVSSNNNNDNACHIFFCATYGEGEPPDNSVLFVHMLKKYTHLDVLMDPKEEEATLSATNNNNTAIPTNLLLQDLNVAVFGLGNKQYDHYNAMGKFVYKALQVLGAKPMLELGLGDDDDDLENDFEVWKDQKLWPTLTKRFISATAMEKQKKLRAHEPISLPDCPLRVVYHDNDAPSPPQYDLPLEAINRNGRHFFTALQCPVSHTRELRTASTNGSTLHVEIDAARAQTIRGTAAAAALSYRTADNLGVLPVNAPTIVAQVAHCLEYDLDRCFSVSAADNHEWHGAPFPNPTTIRECLTYYCDVQALPRRSDLKLLSNYCLDPTDKSALQRMASKEGRNEYNEKFREGFVGLVDLFKLCPSLKLPLEHFLNICPPLQARFYTISSSSRKYPTSIHLTVAVTKHERKDKTVFDGVCSSHLAGRPPTVRVFARDSTFRLPQDPATPILMIGPGTGVAPMRAFLQERALQKQSGETGVTILYFGCKKSSDDYIYRDELEGYYNEGILDKLYLAFSREQKEKVYVQHLLRENASETWDLVHSKGAHIYVCGGVKMGHDVFEALQWIVAEHGKRSSADAKDYLEKLGHDHRFIQELWA